MQVLELSGKKRQQQAAAVRRARRNSNVARLDRLAQLGSRFWSPYACLSTGHWRERAAERSITWTEFLRTWTRGVWDADPEPDTFVARHGRCKVVIRFEEETPVLVTAVYVAEHLAA